MSEIDVCLLVVVSVRLLWFVFVFSEDTIVTQAWSYAFDSRVYTDAENTEKKEEKLTMKEEEIDL